MLIDLNKDAWKLEDVYSKLGAEEILCQLCEECGELIKAANKVRRAMKGTTPVSLDDAKTNLIEECADVLICIDALALGGIVDQTGVQFVGKYKNDRWYRRTVCDSATTREVPVKPDRSRWEGCETCKTLVCAICKFATFEYDDHPCDLCEGGSLYEKVNFCPTCGRPLTEEAWAELERRIG